MSNKGSNSGGGVGFMGVLTAVFFGLKVAGLIDWSWWWVFSPIWISLLLLVVIIAIVAVYQAVKPKRGYW